MSRSIHCLHCGVSLALPPQAEGRKVRCPKCGGRFQVGGLQDAPKSTGPAAPGPNPDSTFELRKASSVELPVAPVKGGGPGQPGTAKPPVRPAARTPFPDDVPLLPLAEGDLRETFDLPLMTEAAPAASKIPAPGRQAADATALFDGQPVAPRRKAGGDARTHARRCPTCGGVVPVGMSICQTCGLDLETGMRVGLEDDLAPAPAPARPALPIAALVVGGLSAAVSVFLAVFALVLWNGGTAGALYFLPVAGFGVYSAVQFLRGRSVKPLLTALTLGALIDVSALIALPIYNAQAETQVIHRTPGNDDPEAEDEVIKPVAERLDTNKITTGIAVLVLYALVCVYLLSPQVQRHARR